MTTFDLSTSSEFLKQFEAIITASNSILITSHKNPDDDSFSSVISMISILKIKYPGKKIDAMYSGDFRNRWTSFENSELVQSVYDISDNLGDYDCIVVLDVSGYDRFCSNTAKFIDFKGKKICIDHHKTEVDISAFDLFFLQADVVSASELIYRLFCENEKNLDPKLCENLLLGILGDSAWFGVNMPPEHAYILSIAERLMVEGNINLEVFRSRFRGFTENVFKVMQELMKNASFDTVAGWPRFMSSFLSREFAASVEENDLREGCDIYIGSYGKSMNDILWGFIVYPSKNGEVKVSLRSRPEGVNVRIWAEEMEAGGGHNGSSGMRFFPDNRESLDPKGYIDVLKGWMRTNEAPAYEGF